MERWQVKLVSLILVFIITEIATLLPLKVSSYFKRMGSKGIRIISYMMCFGGGVFLGLYTLHMAPDVREILGRSLIKPNNISYPLADFIIVIGFFMMLFSENAMMKLQSNRFKKKEAAKEIVIANSFAEKGRSPSVIGKRLAQHEIVQYETSFNTESNTKTNGDANDHHYQNKKLKEHTINDKVKCSEEDDAVPHTAAGGHHAHSHHLIVTRSLMLLLALSLHHIFEGISLGLQYSSQAVWNMTIAILSHEVVIAFSLGMQLVHAYESRKKIVIAATMCSSMAPIGMLIGMLIMELGKTHGNNSMEIVNGFLQAISTGVFIYITFFEILAGEISHEDTNMTKLMFILFGFLVLAALGLIPEDTGKQAIISKYNDTNTLSKLFNVTD